MENHDQQKPIRNCDDCSLCCMVLRIDELDKPKGVWCNHCSTRKCCDIYDRRPDECKKFYCGWLTNDHLGPEWKPSKSKIVLVGELDGNRLAAHMHPNHPDAWRKEPFYSTLKEWSLAAVPRRGQVVVYVGLRACVIFPDRDVDLGVVEDDDRIITGETDTPHGMQLQAYKIHKDDPRIANLAEQNWNIAAKK